jgi:hypothetical protein
MELQQQVVNLELSKRMKDLGFKQESLFWWQPLNYGDPYLASGLRDRRFDSSISSYTVAELGELLPVEISKAQSKHQYYLEIVKEEEGKWYIRYRNTVDSFMNLGFEAETEADARAKMLCYLKENNLL